MAGLMPLPVQCCAVNVAALYKKRSSPNDHPAQISCKASLFWSVQISKKHVFEMARCLLRVMPREHKSQLRAQVRASR